MEAASFDLSSIDIANCMAEVDRVAEKALEGMKFEKLDMINPKTVMTLKQLLINFGR